MFNFEFALYGVIGAIALAAGSGGYGYYKGDQHADLACVAGKAKDTIGQLTRDNKDLSQLIVDNGKLQAGVNDAINEQTKELANLRVAVAGSTSAVNRLRGTTDTASARLSDATRAAAVEYATTANAVLRDSAERYRTLGANADGHVADVRALQRGWPRNQPANAEATVK